MQGFAVFAMLAFVIGVVAQEGKRYPVSRVVKLLEDMKQQLQEEHMADEEVYEKLACWCETNDKEKTKAIADAEAKISDLATLIETLTQESAQLATEIGDLEKEVAKDQESLDVATALRAKQLAEFNEEEKEMLQAIKALQAAIVVLSKHHKASLVTGSKAAAHLSAAHQSAVHQSTHHESAPSPLSVKEAEDAVTAVANQLRLHQKLLKHVVTSKQQKLIMSLSQVPEGGHKRYTPQSGEIFGILEQMKETFENNMSDSQKEELENQRQFQELKQAKEAEIAAGKAQIESKTQQKADVDEKNAQAAEDKEDTENALSADQKFLIFLKDKCEMTDKQWDERKQTRMQEIQAVSEAIAILSNDDARDTFSKTFNFLQRTATRSDEARRRKDGAEVLARVAAKTGSKVIAALAASIQLDAFTKVKEAIDKLVKNLMKEKKEEIEHRDFCIEGLNENELETAKKVHKKEGTEMEIAGLETTVKTLTGEVKVLTEEIADLRQQLKRAGEDREMENKDFQETVADQKETIQLLNKAVGVLEKVYGERPKVEYAAGQPGASLAQEEPFFGPRGAGGTAPPPPPDFKDYQKSHGTAGSILMTLDQIINDAKALMAEATHDENQAQKTYEEFGQKTNASIEAKTKSVTDKNEDKAKAEKAISQAQTELDTVNDELDGLASAKGGLHKSCDYYMNNFEVRQAARDEEIEALKQTKAILAGMKMD